MTDQTIPEETGDDVVAEAEPVAEATPAVAEQAAAEAEPVARDEAAPNEAAPDEAVPEEPVTEVAAESEVPVEPAQEPIGVDNILEALLLASEAPLSLDALQKLVGVELNLGKADLRAALAKLDERLAGTAAELREVASGWRIQVRQDYAQWVARLWQEKPPKFSRAMLETLALIVYRQPITRGEIEDVRGVAVSPNILRTLMERNWVREVGHKEVPGRPALFGTTPQFLDDFNLKSLDQLPSLPEIKDAEQLEAALARLVPGTAGVTVATAATPTEDTSPEETPPTVDMAPQDATIH
jgi:segregation and condensation protein B